MDGVSSSSVWSTSFDRIKKPLGVCRHFLRDPADPAVSEVAEGGIRVKLRLVETAGFGDQLDKDQRSTCYVTWITCCFCFANACLLGSFGFWSRNVAFCMNRYLPFPKFAAFSVVLLVFGCVSRSFFVLALSMRSVRSPKIFGTLCS